MVLRALRRNPCTLAFICAIVIPGSSTALHSASVGAGGTAAFPHPARIMAGMAAVLHSVVFLSMYVY